ncbi:MAG: glycosyltransferase family 2 protein [Fimbriiglobus sp.]|nr:glycosyltransferase family 2 protein [Fimbriiglobus sp.]
MTDDSPARPRLLSLVVPVFNEHESLVQLVGEIDAAVATLPAWQHEILFIDDGSTDASWERIVELTGRGHVRGLRFRRNFGKAAALNAGFIAARGEVVFTLDADLQDNPVEIPRFLEALAAGKDVVSGYKQVRHDPWHKVFPSRVFNWMVSTVTGVQLHDHNCGFKAYRAAVVKEVRLYGELHRYVPVLATARGFKVGELVVHHRARRFGRSKYGWKRFLKGFLDLVHVRMTTAFGWQPMHLFGTAAVILWLLAAVTGVGAAGLLTLVSGRVTTFFGIILLLVSGIAGVIGGQSIWTGLLAELHAARRTDEPFVVSEKINP